MIWVIFILGLLACIILPGVWVKQVLKKYSEPADRYRKEGSGAELARHLLDNFELLDVKVEETDKGDHYDPVSKAVRLSANNFNGYSLTAITVAAHEVGHALQDSRDEALFNARQRLVNVAIMGERAGRVILMMAPLVLLVARLPQLSILMLLLAVASMAMGTLVHLVTLPVELDASYGKALPILEEGDYLQAGDLPHARRILKAAALTYVAGSLASLLNLGRWIAVLRR
ncbi:MAG: zinc metallopeptidase [Gammaproteobacteria bacterium]|nr:zinc metallopeptidase [Gammaproteobacteria bacterium]MCP4088328.1 zinc metallopeptidase [Gammaproteobacteria bacterium]MCP4276361.1 zinc metallopeptidase [Gammaproteobacteria bacterium]MCP4831008.1 zinc metallopeptidase [Gammaproteobacteria bacterium]MCP4927471.1 zinc metallopeptidase [Gammaproteobacteria bacterium]